MDLTLASLGQTDRLMPSSVLGMLWLQTHFEDEHWDLISRGEVELEPACSACLCQDATAAGLMVSRIPAPAPATPPQSSPHQPQS